MSNNPTNLTALTAKVTADNGGSFADLLQPANQMAYLVTPTDLATAITAITTLRTGLIAIGVMKSS